MRVLIVVPEQNQATGNWVTAERFQAELTQRKHAVLLLASGLEPAPDFASQVTAFAPDVVLLLHAYRTGRPWFRVMAAEQYPVVVLLTGTDINLGLEDTAQQATIHDVMRLARSVLLQNRRLLTELVERYPALHDKVYHLPPGIQLGEEPFDLRRVAAADKTDFVFFCPAGIRPVKGVLELVGMFDSVAKSAPNVRLVFAGPVLDETYARQFQQAVAERPWASYLGTIPPEAMASAMRGTDVIVNNSRAEGLSNALLEAVTLGIPVLATNIPGNAEIISPGVNGLLYTDAASFTQFAQQLIRDGSLRKRLGKPSERRYDPGQEAETLDKLLLQAAQPVRV